MMSKQKPTLLITLVIAFASVIAIAGNCHAQLRNPQALDYGSYGKQMNRQKMDRFAVNEGNLHIGTLRVHPSFHERVMYDDNIYKVSGTNRTMDGAWGAGIDRKAAERRQSDTLYVATPGLRLNLPMGDRFLYGKVKSLGLNWQSDFKNYDDHTDQNQDNHYVTSSVTIEVLKGYDLTLNQNWAHTDVGAGSETDTLHARDTNTFGVGLRMSQIIKSLKKLDIEIQYQNFDQDYTQRQLERANRNQHSYTFNVYYKLTPKLTIKLPQYTYTDIRYDKHRSELDPTNGDALSDSHSNSLMGGIVWKATARTTGHFNIGVIDRQYERDTHEGSDFAAGSAAGWDTSSATALAIEAGATTTLPWNTTLDINVSRLLRESEFTAKSNSYVSTGGSIVLSNRYKKLLTDYTVGFFQTDFKGVNREDDVLTLAVNANYALTKWAQIEAGYSYKGKSVNSDFDFESEQVNKAYIGFGLGL